MTNHDDTNNEKPTPAVEVDKIKLLEAEIQKITDTLEEKVLETLGERRPFLLVVNIDDNEEQTRNSIASNLEGDGVARIAMQVLQVQSAKMQKDAPRIVKPH